MRAREYDPKLGRFTSRDAVLGNVKTPNSLNAYGFANQNCYLYTDPKGEFTMIELNMTTSMENYFQAFKAAAINEAKRRLKESLINALTSQVTKPILNLLPGGDFDKLGAGFKGATFGEIISKGFCSLLGAGELPEGITLEAGVSENGEPRDNGLDCESMLRGDLPSLRPGTRRPDFIIGPRPHGHAGNHPMTYLIGEVKYRPITLYSDYVLNRKNKAGQFDAIRFYSAKHTFSHIAVFITLKRDPTLYNQLRATLGAKCAQAGCIGVLVTDLHVRKGRR
jgi:hypothetical protein